MTSLREASGRRRGIPAALLLLSASLLVGSCKPEGPAGPGEGPSLGPDAYSVTLQWDAPTEDAAGNPLEDLVGYRVHYRDSSPANGPGASTEDVDAAATRATISDLPAGTWFFGVTARDVSGNESVLSNEVRVEVGS